MLKYLEGNQARQLFKRAVDGKNPLTPYSVEFRGVKVVENPSSHIVYELSQDFQETMFGVTVVRNGKPHREASKAFESLDEAREYGNKLISWENCNGS